MAHHPQLCSVDRQLRPSLKRVVARQQLVLELQVPEVVTGPPDQLLRAVERTRGKEDRLSRHRPPTFATNVHPTPV